MANTTNTKNYTELEKSNKMTPLDRHQAKRKQQLEKTESLRTFGKKMKSVLFLSGQHDDDNNGAAVVVEDQIAAQVVDDQPPQQQEEQLSHDEGEGNHSEEESWKLENVETVVWV